MLTKIAIRNFKRFDNVEVELGNPVVFIGPNDSGKTTALQALALWDLGVRRWNEKRRGKPAPEKRPGVTINRRDLVAVPTSDAVMLWHDLKVRNVSRQSGKQRTDNIRIDIAVEGVDKGSAWACGLEFDYANDESFYCRPLRLRGDPAEGRMPIPEEAVDVRVAFLPPMSGLAANETRLDQGAVNVRLGEGRTAEVLRNLCYRIASELGERAWTRLATEMETLFGVRLETPEYVPERGEIVLRYANREGVVLDLSASGRGMQQTLLLLAYLEVNPGSVLLLDEPDAHLEVLRQRQIYQLLTETAARTSSQVIAASHSEIVLNEAADRDMVVAFVGKPHRIDDRVNQVRKALVQIGFDQYYQAESTGWVLYLEGSTDLAILREFASTLRHPAAKLLERPFVHYVLNQPGKAYEHFFGLLEAKPDLVGYALFDRLDGPLEEKPSLTQHAWARREIENYLTQRETLLAWVESQAGPDSLFSQPWRDAMETAIDDVEAALGKLGKDSPWSPDTKVSDDFLSPVFEAFYKQVKVENAMRKTTFYRLAPHVPEAEIDAEISEVLDQIIIVASTAAL